MHPHFLIEHGVGQADIEAARGQIEILRQFDFHPVGIDLHRHAGFDDIGHAFHRHPQPGVTAHGPAVQAVVQIFLHRRRIQHRDAAGFQDMFALMRGGRRLGRVIVAGNHQHPAMRGRAGHIGVLEHVAAAIYAGAFAVPKRKDAVVLRAWKQIDLLRAPDTGGGEIFIDPGMKFDMLRGQVFFRFDSGQVDAGQRGAAIAGNESGCIQTVFDVALPLQHRNADQRLGAGHENTAALKRKFIVQGNVVGLQGCAAI